MSEREPRFLATMGARCLACGKTVQQVGEFLVHVEREHHFWWISNYTVFHIELTCFRGEKLRLSAQRGELKEEARE